MVLVSAQSNSELEVGCMLGAEEEEKVNVVI